MNSEARDQLLGEAQLPSDQLVIPCYVTKELNSLLLLLAFLEVIEVAQVERSARRRDLGKNAPPVLFIEFQNVMMFLC